MNNNCVNVDGLKEVSQTLLPTLYLRSLETQRKNSIIQDRKSVEIASKIDYDFSSYDSQFSQAVIAIRTEAIDRLVQKILSQQPQMTIVNLGAGLCTRFFRLDNGSSQWINLDLPRVKPVWDSLIGESARSHYLACSVLDFDWIAQIKAITTERVLFIAEGLLMFFTEQEVRQLMNQLQVNFASSEMIFDALGLFLATNSRLNSGDLGIDAAYQWGIKDLKTIETWNQSIQLLDCCYYLDRHKARLGLFGLLSYLPGLRRQIKIGHLRFNS